MYNIMKHFSAFLFIGLMCSISAQAAVITYSYDGEKTTAENGTALQAAIAAATSGDELKVQAGTYVGNFSMKEGVNVSGGWDANFETQTDYATILDANASGRVLEQPANFTTLTIWSNFTIQNGKLTAASSVPANNLGSGVALGKKGQVKHCLIQNNTFTYNGNCMGGGVSNDAVDAATDVCAEDCIIRNNCGTHGGGARVRGTLLNCVIENNNTKDVKAGPAGGVHLQAGRMVGCIVRGNLSGGDTGGVRLYGKCQLINCLVAGNTATGKVGGVGIESANSDVIGCTIVDNDQLTSNAGDNTKCGLSCGATSDNGTKLANNIIWGNKHNGVAQTAQVYYISHYAAANRIYNAIAHQNTTNGIKLSMNNDENDTYLDGDSNEQTGRAPHFADPANGDYSLTRLSPMVNKGNNEVVTALYDLAGNDRIIFTTVDMGAYELPYYTLTVAAYEHATLLMGEDTVVAGDYDLPKGFTDTLTIVADEDYQIKSVTCGDAILVEEEGVYVLPALMADMTLAIEVEQITFDLTVAEFEHATLILDGDTTVAGTYPLPIGHVATATIKADDGYIIKSVACGDAILDEVEGVYTLPAMMADMTLAIEVEMTSTGIDEVNAGAQAVKRIRNGQLFIIRDGKEYNAIGQQLHK